MFLTNGLFGTAHIIMVVVSILLIVLFSILVQKISFKQTIKILLGVGIVSEIIKIFFYIIANEERYGGYLPKTDLPFHLCSIQIIFILLLNILNNEKVKKFILSFMLPSCLIGGFAAILIATDSARNAPIICAQYFLYHIALVVFSIKIYTTDEFKITTKDYFSCLKFLLCLMFFAIYINSMLFEQSMIDNPSLQVNFMYVVNPPQPGLPYLNENHGWFVYIAHYACLILLAITCCYIKPIYESITNKRKANEN